MEIYGITGQTGAGKTTVLDIFSSLGGEVMDCDGIYWMLLSENISLKKDLVENFGDILDEEGHVHRKKLGAVVFGNAEKLELLNHITHPYVIEKVDSLLALAREKGAVFAVIDAIALHESGLSQRCDVIISVVAEESSRIQRIMARDSISHDYAVNRVKAQKSEEFFRENSDIVLQNTGKNKIEFEQYVKNILLQHKIIIP